MSTASTMSRTEEFVRFKPVVVVVGPTAVGKSRVAVRLAKRLQTEVLAADSRQVYRGMDIGTDKPTLEERDGVPHRLIDLVDPDETFNAGIYRRTALPEIDRLHREGRLPLVVGGTGLYVRTLIRGLCEGPEADPTFRAELEEEARRKGAEVLHRELTRVDPKSAARLHPHDQVKIIRALEVYHLLGRPLSSIHQRHGFGELPFSPLLIGLMRERKALYRRIEERVDSQLARGLVDEVRGLLARGYDRRLGSMKGLGYRQIAAYLAGDCDYTEAVRLLKRDTRRFAKRQLTWFRKEPGILWLSLAEDEPVEQLTNKVLAMIEGFLAGLGREAQANKQSGRMAAAGVTAG